MKIESKIDFSILIPTRNRPQLLQECLDSIFEMATKPDRIEALVIIDFEDDYVLSLLSYIKTNYFNIKLLIAHGSQNLNRDCINWAAQASIGKYLWCFNDECQIITDKWDEVLKEKLEKFLSPDRLAYIMINDNTHCNLTNPLHDNTLYISGCCFPLVTRELAECLNGAMPSEIQTHGADSALYRIIQEIPEKILDLSQDIEVLHKSKYNGLKSDTTQERVIGMSLKPTLTCQEHNNYVKRIKEKIYAESH